MLEKEIIPIIVLVDGYLIFLFDAYGMSCIIINTGGHSLIFFWGGGGGGGGSFFFFDIFKFFFGWG